MVLKHVFICLLFVPQLTIQSSPWRAVRQQISKANSHPLAWAPVGAAYAGAAVGAAVSGITYECKLFLKKEEGKDRRGSSYLKKGATLGGATGFIASNVLVAAHTGTKRYLPLIALGYAATHYAYRKAKNLIVNK